MITLYQISLRGITFGVVVFNGKVVRSAPVAKWSLCKSWIDVRRSYSRRGANIVRVKG